MTQKLSDTNATEWSKTQHIILIGRANDEKLNLTKEFYEVVPALDAILNLCQDGSNITSKFNISDNKTVECSPGEYDKVQFIVVILLCVLIVVTVIGNTLIILAVVTTKRLRTVTNCFVTSLAVADWLVGIFVMPPAIAVHIRGRWELGWVLCDIWISLDILLCTASILSLCAISVDRCLAVTRPLSYSRRRRSKRLALAMILCVWLAAAAITCPPMLGWYEPLHNQGGACRYNQNAGYVVFSAAGSFFLPMAVMVYVYARISCVVARRHHQLATAPHNDSKKCRLSCVRTESESNSDKPARQTCKETSCTTKPQLSNRKSDCSNQSDARNTCCFHSELNRSQSKHRLSKEAKFFNDSNDLMTYKSNPKYRSTVKSRSSVRESNDNNRVSSLRRETKTAQTLSLVVGGFIVCWLPFFVYYLLTPFLLPDYVNPALMDVLIWLGWFNSGINPFIYAFYSPEFRLAFWRLTIRKCSRTRC